jgi:hypothetical protein
MEGRDGEPPEVVRACGRAGGEAGGGVDGELGRRSCYCAGRRSLQRREKGRKEKRERVTVAAWWLCWLPMVELVFLVVYRLGLLVFSLEKTTVERWRELQKADGERWKMETGGEAGFLRFLDPIFSSLRPSNPPLFIGGGRGQSCLQWRKISALDSDGKDPNRWLKLGMVHCQIVKCAAAGCLSWPLWGGATSKEGCLVINFVQVLANLVHVKCIKCTCKGDDWTRFSGKIRKIMNSDQTTRRLIPFVFF